MRGGPIKNSFYLAKPRNGGCALTAHVREQLAAERVRLGLSYKDMGQRLGVQGEHYRRMEIGRAQPKYQLLEQWAAALGFAVEVRLVSGGKT